MSTDITIIGGGIVGLATGLHLIRNYKLSLTVLEAESSVAQHQTGHNSGVIHSGLYYKPGSEKARNCAIGREAMYRFCAEHGVLHDRCGKVVVAVEESELPRLEELHRRGIANGLTGMRKLTGPELREYEPHVAGVAGLHIPETGIVDYKGVARKYAELITQAGGTVRTAARVVGVAVKSDAITLQTASGEFTSKQLINCGGLHCDRIARMCGLDPGIMVVPFRGEYSIATVFEPLTSVARPVSNSCQRR